MMHIEHTKVKVRDLVEGYKDDTQTGQVSGLDGKLDTIVWCYFSM